MPTLALAIAIKKLKQRIFHVLNRICFYVVDFHGGAFTLNSAETQKNQSVPLATKSGLRTLVVDYSTAPHAKHPEILEQVSMGFSFLSWITGFIHDALVILLHQLLYITHFFPSILEELWHNGP